MYAELRKRFQEVGISTVLCWGDKESEGFWHKQVYVNTFYLLGSLSYRVSFMILTISCFASMAFVLYSRNLLWILDINCQMVWLSKYDKDICIYYVLACEGRTKRQMIRRLLLSIPISFHELNCH